MNIVNKLTLRHMKLNKKRTLVTIIGIIISVAMITAVSTVVYSIMDFYARNTMESTGYFHFKYKNYKYEDNNKILDEFNVKNYSIIKSLGDYEYKIDKDGHITTTPFAFNENADGIVDLVRVEAVSDNYYKMMNLTPAEGRFPKNSDEIFLSDAMSIRFSSYNVGDKIAIGDKTYTISGKSGNSDFESAELAIPDAWTYPVYTVLDKETLKSDDIVSGYFYAGGVLDNIEERAESVLAKLKKSGVVSGEMVGENQAWYCEGTDIAYNYRVLAYLGLSRYDNINEMMSTLKLILIIIIIVGSVSLIANGFIISISERSRYLGMLASIGATKKQKRGSVYFEGFIEGIIAIPLGIIAGIGGIWITFKCIEPLVRELSNSKESLNVIVNGSVILWTVVFSALTIFLSAYIPAKRASKIAPIDAIRLNKDVKITSKTVKTMGITKKIFGFEGDLALKNLKRNKKKYRVTVFSMFISLTLFISVYSFVFFMKNGISVEMEDEGYDVRVVHGFAGHWDESILENEKFASVAANILKKSAKDVEKSEIYSIIELYNCQCTELTDETMFDERYIEFLGKNNWKRYDAVDIVTMPEKDLRKYLESINLDYDKFVERDDNVILFDGIQMTAYNDKGDRKTFIGDVYNDSLTDIKCEYTFMEEYDEKGNLIEEPTEKRKEDVNYHVFSVEDKLLGFYKSTIYVLVTPKMAERFCEEFDGQFRYMLTVDVDDDKTLVDAFESESEKLGEDSGSYVIINNLESMELVDKSVLLISVFVYGFIILMSLICVANIVNTISTSIALRRREFAMLKSVGMTDASFRKMIAYESAFYGIKALIFGLPVGTGIMLLIRKSITDQIEVNMGIPWMGYVIAIVGVFTVIGTTMIYSARKIKKENVIDALKNENA